MWNLREIYIYFTIYPFHAVPLKPLLLRLHKRLTFTSFDNSLISLARCLPKMSQNKRANKPPKRKQSTDHNNQSQPSTKHLKASKKVSIPIKTTKQVIQDFETAVGQLFEWHRLDIQPTSLFLSPKDGYPMRHVLFDALSKHLFPILSLSRHYLNTLETINICGLHFHGYKKKDLEFLGQFFDRLALLPHLRSLDIDLTSHVNSQDFEGWGLAGELG